MSTQTKRRAEKQLTRHAPSLSKGVTSSRHHVLASPSEDIDVMRVSVINADGRGMFSLPLKLMSDACIQSRRRAVNFGSLFRETRKHFVAVVWLPPYPSSLTHLVPKLKEDLPFRLDSAATTSPQRSDSFSRSTEFPVLSE